MSLILKVIFLKCDVRAMILDFIVLVCRLKFSLLSIFIPRYLLAGLGFIARMYMLVQEDLSEMVCLKIISWDLVGFGFGRHFLNHIMHLSDSLCSDCIADDRVLLCDISAVSSAYCSR